VIGLLPATRFLVAGKGICLSRGGEPGVSRFRRGRASTDSACPRPDEAQIAGRSTKQCTGRAFLPDFLVALDRWLIKIHEYSKLTNLGVQEAPKKKSLRLFSCIDTRSVDSESLIRQALLLTSKSVQNWGFAPIQSPKVLALEIYLRAFRL